jgi:hypothetical protein
MGSFANSLHVRSDDAGPVADTVRQLLADTGYVPTNKEPKLGPFQATTGHERAVVVCEAHQGWVGVLDSDLVQSMSLAGELSRRLDTYAMQFLVHDSDSWHYGLYQAGTQIDEFDSSGGFDDDDEDFGGDDEEDADFTSSSPTISAADWPALQQKLNERMVEQQRRMEAEMPADIRDIQQKIQTGAASAEEMQKYAEWAQAQTARIVQDLSDIFPPGMLPGQQPSAAPRQKPPGGFNPEIDTHLETLRPLLAAGISDGEVLETLGREAVFAEETLAEFLPLLGIAPLFAHLSYPYLAESSDAELRTQNIKVAQRLRYVATPALSR